MKDNRRTWLAATAVAALAAGVAGGWWHRAGRQSGVAGEPLPPDFWSHRFDTPAGPPLALAPLQGRPLLINFWATWCPPCVKEMPDLARFHQDHASQGWQVVGLAIDGPTPVRQFLSRSPVPFPIGLAGFGGTELASALGNTTGGLPFSVVIDRNGRLRERKMGATDLPQLNQWGRRYG